MLVVYPYLTQTVGMAVVYVGIVLALGYLSSASVRCNTGRACARGAGPQIVAQRI